MKEFKRKKIIKNADKFRLEFLIFGEEKPFCRDFESQRSLEQWAKRNSWQMIPLRRFAKFGDEWQPFAIIGKKTLLLDELETIINDLKNEYYKSSK